MTFSKKEQVKEKSKLSREMKRITFKDLELIYYIQLYSRLSAHPSLCCKHSLFILLLLLHII